MNITRSTTGTLQRLGALLALTGLAACGGVEEETGCPALVAVVTAGFGCLGTVTVSSPPPPPAPADAPPSDPTPAPPPGSDVVRMQFHVEYEPNSTLDNANPVSFRNATSDEHVGIDITGAVNQPDDGKDFFIFTPPRSGHFLVYLCTDTCTESLQSDEMYLMIYDQNQSTVAGTAVGVFDAQRVGLDLEAGLAYYVEVNGYNTGSTPQDYRLVIIH